MRRSVDSRLANGAAQRIVSDHAMLGWTLAACSGERAALLLPDEA